MTKYDENAMNMVIQNVLNLNQHPLPKKLYNFKAT